MSLHGIRHYLNACAKQEQFQDKSLNRGLVSFMNTFSVLSGNLPENKIIHWLNKMKYDFCKRKYCVLNHLSPIYQNRWSVWILPCSLLVHIYSAQNEAGAIVTLPLTIQRQNCLSNTGNAQTL